MRAEIGMYVVVVFSKGTLSNAVLLLLNVCVCVCVLLCLLYVSNSNTLVHFRNGRFIKTIQKFHTFSVTKYVDKIDFKMFFVI